MVAIKLFKRLLIFRRKAEEEALVAEEQRLEEERIREEMEQERMRIQLEALEKVLYYIVEAKLWYSRPRPG